MSDRTTWERAVPVAATTTAANPPASGDDLRDRVTAVLRRWQCSGCFEPDHPCGDIRCDGVGGEVAGVQDSHAATISDRSRKMSDPESDPTTLTEAASRVNAWLDKNWKYVADDLYADLRLLAAARVSTATGDAEGSPCDDPDCRAAVCNVPNWFAATRHEKRLIKALSDHSIGQIERRGEYDWDVRDVPVDALRDILAVSPVSVVSRPEATVKAEALREAAEDFEVHQRSHARSDGRIHVWAEACDWLRDRAVSLAAVPEVPTTEDLPPAVLDEGKGDE